MKNNLIKVAFVLSLMITISGCSETLDATKMGADCSKISAGEIGRLIKVRGGSFEIGSNNAYRDEAKAHTVTVSDFWISQHEVTNKQFRSFVEETGYVTLAETELSKEEYPGIPDEQRIPGSVVFVPPVEANGELINWWQFVPGANWRHPEGPESSIDDKDLYPVVHVAYRDALAYAKWKGHELPSEAEWEYAAKALKNTPYSWGNSLTLDGEHQANSWQGIFPLNNTGADGFVGRSPIGCFAPNNFDLYDMIGNVWEWTSSWYYPGHQQERLEREHATGFDPQQRGVAVRVIKGGSFLCAPNYCQRYRPSARHAQDLSLGASHLGFRTITRNAGSE